MARITLADGQELIHQDDRTPLLRSLESHGHYSECRNGYCGACKTVLTKGKVKYLTEPMAYLRPGQILPCCCVPDGDIELA
ncbi:class I ribonucleotide reductase maintenance protein YfaE [Ferrimonas balearica]|uniref:class I ribonucleotide reductase maintenance protein YfaE n=1 Tax=Ferrimonas balearica TaxID=44012 RepID=UPI001F35DDED|nr:class I ribonucleotide reductase maintenance protein YfaE [Ferrimonas balearica]MBY6016636.1 2Fe-2S ferredoxin-like protein [Halomonas denitrificans]MBY6095071.1 2Fe-2S ferredoxin-like protein [Ferrimonas balearica]